MATNALHEMVECVGGGPCDGGPVELVRGATVFRMRIGNVWHTYVLRPSDCGMILVYTGTFYANPPDTPQPAEANRAS